METKDNEITYEKIYDSIISELSPFLLDNNNFNIRDDELKTEILYIIIELNQNDFLKDKKEYLNKIKKELLIKYKTPNNVFISDSTKAYLNEIGQFRLLTKDEEIELFKKYKEGDLESKNRIINCNLRLVVSIAKSYSMFYSSLLDTIQEGNIGLMTAVERFNPSLGNRFSTYATWWIRQSITRAIENKGPLIKIPARINKNLNKIKKFETKYLQEKGILPSDEEIAKELEISEQEVQDIKSVNYTYKSINEKLKEDDDSEFGDFISSDEELENKVIKSLLSEELNNYFKEAELTSDQINVLIYRFGLIDGKELTLEQVGKILNKSRDRIRQIEIRALIKLKRSSYKYKIMNYYDDKYDTEKVKAKKPF